MKEGSLTGGGTGAEAACLLLMVCEEREPCQLFPAIDPKQQSFTPFSFYGLCQQTQGTVCPDPRKMQGKALLTGEERRPRPSLAIHSLSDNTLYGKQHTNKMIEMIHI